MKTKICPKCKESKTLNEFYTDKTKKYDVSSYCKKCHCTLQIKWRENNPDYEKVNRKKNPEKTREWHKKMNEKRRSKPIFKLSDIISASIKNSLKSGKNGRHWESLLNYTIQDLMTHLENQFKKGMSWDNQGMFGWHIDHIIPISLWQFNTPQDREFKQCWALCNLQPLWAEENLRKSNKINFSGV
jgi:hypothetical protein